MGLSQTRVVQLRDRVLDWMAAELPRLETAPPEQRLAVAEYLAVERMEFLYGTSLAAWRQSQSPETVERRSGVTGDASTTVRTSHGNVRYLQQAMRVAKEMAKFAVRPLMMAADEDEDVEESHPLEEDCSARETILLQVDGRSVASANTNRGDNITYEDFFRKSEAENVAQAHENGPVQAAVIGHTEDCKPGTSATPMNRHQRRARRRRLEKALKRRAK